jgi:DNA-binding CsgD family transcriptional regulator
MDTILNLSHGGKTRAQIARELGITQNEVDLVIGMYKKTM